MIRLATAALAAGLSLAAQAQHSLRGPNGGEIVDASEGPYHIEFVVKGAELTVFVLDEDNKPVPVNGTTGRVVVQERGKTTTVPLQAGSANRLAATLPAPLNKGSRMVLSGKLGDGRSFQARFVQK